MASTGFSIKDTTTGFSGSWNGRKGFEIRDQAGMLIAGWTEYSVSGQTDAENILRTSLDAAASVA